MSPSLECLCQHPDAACEEPRSGNPRNHAAYRNHFLDQHEYRQRDDPQHIHHAADEQKRHQRPATADAVKPVLRTERERAELGPEAAVMHDEIQRRAAMRQARILQRRPLVKARDDQHDPAKDAAGACQHRRDQARASSALRQRGNSRKRGPGEQGTRGKPAGGGEGVACAAPAARRARRAGSCGVADGVIMPTIITAHMAKVKPRSGAFLAAGAGIIVPIGACAQARACPAGIAMP